MLIRVRGLDLEMVRAKVMSLLSPSVEAYRAYRVWENRVPLMKPSTSANLSKHVIIRHTLSTHLPRVERVTALFGTSGDADLNLALKTALWGRYGQCRENADHAITQKRPIATDGYKCHDRPR